MTNEPWVSVDDLAKHLGVAKDSIYRWIDHKGLLAHRIGRLWKFKLSEVDDWVRDAERQAKSQGKTVRGGVDEAGMSSNRLWLGSCCEIAVATVPSFFSALRTMPSRGHGSGRGPVP